MDSSLALRRAERDFDRLMKAYKAFGDELAYFHEQALGVPERLLEPHDGGPRLRPHTIKGWWQVWSGGICIALLEPEDVTPVKESTKEKQEKQQEEKDMTVTVDGLKECRMHLVVIESPYAGALGPEGLDALVDEAMRHRDVTMNVAYAKRCVRDCLRRGEAPYASHLFFAQEGILEDHIAEERELGIAAGFLWGAAAKTVVVYVDRGISEGMRRGIRAAAERGARIEVRALDRAIGVDDIKTVFDVAGQVPFVLGQQQQQQPILPAVNVCTDEERAMLERAKAAHAALRELLKQGKRGR